MRLLVENYTEKDIARQLGIAPSTVKTHRQHLYEKLGVKNVLGLFKYFSKREASPQHGESLVGYWISKYDFQQHVPYPTSKAPRFREATQINLEFVEVASGGFFSYQGKNVCGTRSDSSTPHEHALRIRVRNQLVVGIWENSNSSGMGCFQFFLQSDSRCMFGRHLGNTSARMVKSGTWIWIKANAPKSFSPNPSRLRPFTELFSIVEEIQNTGRHFSIEELFR